LSDRRFSTRHAALALPARSRACLNGLKFKRQVPVDRFIVDFCCTEARFIVELDGGQRATRLAEDMDRTTILEAMGYLVLRFWNNDVLQNTDGVLEEILNTAKQQ
jgi:very-short-patch-repair endonuclease